MKRAHSPSPSTSDDTEPENRTEREASPSPEAKTKAAGKAKSPRKLKSKPKPDDVKPETDESDHKPPTLKKARAKDTSAPGEWTAEKRETLVERIFENGYKNTDVAGLAAEVSRTGRGKRGGNADRG